MSRLINKNKKDRMLYEQLGAEWLRLATAPSNLLSKNRITCPTKIVNQNTKKALVSKGLFASVESSFRELPSLCQRSANMIAHLEGNSKMTTKKTDWRLRECLSTLVGAKYRPLEAYYHSKKKKSTKNL